MATHVQSVAEHSAKRETHRERAGADRKIILKILPKEQEGTRRSRGSKEQVYGCLAAILSKSGQFSRFPNHIDYEQIYGSTRRMAH
ncbi:unnamed protein product [Coregonus sp. 'balchen']|nr:unnamed protein product [Coregonus sp. 'balchen']